MCIGGSRAAPPADCGGPIAFQDRRDAAPWEARELLHQIVDCVDQGDVTAMRDRIDEVISVKEWLLLDKFDRRKVNRRLRQYAAGDEVIVGKSVIADGGAKCFAFVNREDAKPKRRLFEVLKAQGLQANQQLMFLSDGGDKVRDLHMYLSSESEHWLDWFHITMWLTVMGQYEDPGDGTGICEAKTYTLRRR